MAEYIVNTDVEEARYKAMGADYSVYFNNKLVTLLGNPVKESIVRCKDCKHYESLGLTQGWLSVCMRLGIMTLTNSKGFCAWGEHKEE